MLTAAVDDSSRVYYESFADVTDLITKQGKVQVSGVATASTRTDGDPTYYGGWALVVVYEAPGTHQDVSVYDGGAWVARDSSTTFDFDRRRATPRRWAWWPGTATAAPTGDTLSLNGTPLVPLRWDGSAGSAEDAFNSTAMGSRCGQLARRRRQAVHAGRARRGRAAPDRLHGRATSTSSARSPSPRPRAESRRPAGAARLGVAS